MKSPRKEADHAAHLVAPSPRRIFRVATSLAWKMEEAAWMNKSPKFEDIDIVPIEDEDEAEAEELSSPPRPRARVSATTALVGAVFDVSISPEVRRRLTHAKALAVVIVVPGTSWVAPMEAHFRKVFGSRWMSYAAKDGIGKASSLKQAGDSDEVARNLARGRCVVGFAADVALLSPTLVAAADVKIRCSAPTGPVLRTAITRFTKRSPGVLSESHAVGLDLSDLVAAFRPGTGAEKIAQRLAATAAAIGGIGPDNSLPVLATAVEYGAARTWGLGLAKDLVEYRAHRLEWAQIPRGIVLHGEPGTGKSLYSRMLASACSLPIVATSVADWFVGPRGGYLHEVIAAMRSAFDRATALAGAAGCAILYIDELDSIPNRATLDSRNSDYWKPLCNDLLTRLDNSMADARRGIIVVGSTNNLSAIDPALMRPGRLELAIEIERPDHAGTLNILRHHAPDLSESDLAEIASLAERSTGAEIMYLVRESRRLARHAGRPLALDDFKTTLMPKIEVGADGLWRICVHEAGHATACLSLEIDSVRRVVVGYRAGSGGHTLMEHDREDLPTRQRIEDRVTIILAGRAAERVALMSESAGAGKDVMDATRMVASMHASAGMGDTIAFLAEPDAALEALRYDAALLSRVERDLQDLQRRADDLVRHHRPAVIAIATALRERRHLSGEAVREIFLKHAVPYPSN